MHETAIYELDFKGNLYDLDLIITINEDSEGTEIIVDSIEACYKYLKMIKSQQRCEPPNGIMNAIETYLNKSDDHERILNEYKTNQ